MPWFHWRISPRRCSCSSARCRRAHRRAGLGATQIADTLATIIRKNKLASTIQGKEYVRVEGWTTLAASGSDSARG